MSFINSLLLGALQGATEFLPVSSSAHLVLFGNLLNADLPGIVFEIVVHLGTLISILVMFRQDIAEMLSRIVEDRDFYELITIAVATIPIAIIGPIFKSNIETAFSTVFLVGVCLIITGIILSSTRWTPLSNLTKISLMTAFLIGVSQAFALLPGISRSGITISVALWLGISAFEAGRFSFLIAIPALIGSMLLNLPDIILVGSNKGHLLILLIGFSSAFVVGLVALKMLISLVESGKLYFFSGYCFFLGIIVLMVIA